MSVTRTAPTLNATAQPDALSTSVIMLAADAFIMSGAEPKPWDSRNNVSELWWR